jgi:MFS transporter, DHA1 family, tetracycline resistance protein
MPTSACIKPLRLVSTVCSRSVAAVLPIFLVAQLAQQSLQSVWVPYTTYRFDWSVTDVGMSLAIVGLLFAVV